VDLKEYRRNKGMSRAEMVRHLSPHMRGAVLTEQFLADFESGTGDEYRGRAIVDAAEKAFPDLKNRVMVKGKNWKFPLRDTNLRRVIGLVIFFLVTFILFLIWGNHKIFDSTYRYLTLVTLIFATIGAIYTFFKK
jgi:hypothetical protein